MLKNNNVFIVIYVYILYVFYTHLNFKKGSFFLEIKSYVLNNDKLICTVGD
jgi:hypothetical protein